MDRIRQLLQFLETEPDDPFLNYALAIEYQGVGKMEEADNIFMKLIQNAPEYTATYYHYGKSLQKKGELTRAEEVYRKGILLCQKKKEQHTLAELQSALNNMLYDEE